MWEFSLNVDNVSRELIDKKVQELNEKFQLMGGFVCVFSDISTYVLFVCQNDEYNAKKLITQFVMELIEYDLKSKFFRKHLKYTSSNLWKFECLVQALCSFDRLTDFAYIKKKIILDYQLDLMGFVRFKCKELIEKWQELAEVTNDNLGFLNYEQTFVDIIQFLLEAIPKTCQVEIVGNDTGYDVFETDNNAKIKSFLIDNEVELLRFLVTRNPEKIILDDNQKEFWLFVRYIFCNRVSFPKSICQKTVDNK